MRTNGSQPKRRSKLVRSDLKDVTPSRRGAAFPHDNEQTSPTRKNRHRLSPGARSTHTPRTIPQGDPELHGGSERAERKRRGTPPIR
jgi:hypothetical protein